jgi:hypothetical protein
MGYERCKIPDNNYGFETGYYTAQEMAELFRSSAYWPYEVEFLANCLENMEE